MAQTTKKMLGIVGITLAVYLGIRYFLPAVVPFLIAYLFVRGIYPFAEKAAGRLPLKKETITLLVLLAGGAVLFMLLWFIGGKVCQQICRMAEHLEEFEAQADQIAHRCCQFVEKRFGIDGESFMYVLEQNVERAEERIQSSVMPNLVQNTMPYVMQGFKYLGMIFLVIVATLLLMKDYDEIRKKLEVYSWYGKSERIVDQLWHVGGAYLKAQLLLLLIVSTICVVGLLILGNPYALVVGILIGLLDVLPFIGTGTVFLPWALISLLKGDFFHAAAYVTLFLAANTTREYLEPRLIGEKVGVYPIVIAIAVYGGVWVYGIFGVFLGPLSLFLIRECAKEIL